MAYANTDFWDRYKKFAAMSRQRHTSAFAELVEEPDHGSKVMDLGCGQALIGMHVLPDDVEYLGIDKEPGIIVNERGRSAVMKVDYQDKERLAAHLGYYQPSLVVSWFSTDVVMHPDEARKLYKFVFETCPAVGGIFTAGFYYDDFRRLELEVKEEGELSSFQVDRGHFLPGFQTKRIEVQAPSRLFGKEVVEVFTYIKRQTIV